MSDLAHAIVSDLADTLDWACKGNCWRARLGSNPSIRILQNHVSGLAQALIFPVALLTLLDVHRADVSCSIALRDALTAPACELRADPCH